MGRVVPERSQTDGYMGRVVPERSQTDGYDIL